MITTPNLGLIAWNLPTDPYDSEELATNWAKVDQHDHTPGKGALITTGAIADAAITASKLAPSAFPTTTIPDGSITALKLATDAVTTVKVQDAQVTDAKLAAPTNSIFKTLLHGVTTIPSGSTSATAYMARTAGAITTGVVGTDSPPSSKWIVATDYTSTLTPKLRVRAQVFTKSTAPSVNYTFGIYPITISTDNFTLGALVGSSGILVNTTASTSAIVSNQGAEVNLPATGLYTVGVLLSGTSSAAVTASWELQLRHT